MDTAVSPAEPTDFLRLIIIVIRQRATAIEEMTAATDDQGLQNRVEACVETVTRYTGQMDDILEMTQFGTFNALSSMLNYNDAWQIHAARRLRTEHPDALTDDASAAIDDMIEVLELFRIARAYFKTKTIYMERELAKLSRVLFYVGIPSLFVAGTTILVYASETGATVGGEYLYPGVPIVATIATAPLAVLFAYAIRIATVATRTPSIGAFHTEHDWRVVESE